MSNQIPNWRIKTLGGCLMVAFLSHVAWSTTQIHQLESKLARVEASHYALGRYTFDLGTAVVRTNAGFGLSGKQLADNLLASMEQDEVLRPAVKSTRSPVIFIQDKRSPESSTWALSR